VLLAGCATGQDEVVASNSPIDSDASVNPGDAEAAEAADDAVTQDDSTWPGEDSSADHVDEPDWPGDAPEAAAPSACGVAGGVTVTTSGRQAGASDTVEAWLEGTTGQVITGLGLRINNDAVKTFRVRFQPVLADGSLGPPVEQRAGAEPTGSLEADIDLPDCFVLVGFGARSNSDDAKTLVLWGAPLSPDGSLGAPQEFRGGSEPSGSVEGEFHAAAGRVVTGAGLGVSDDNVEAIKSTTDAWTVQ
jgi:hypothetical protein